MTDRPSDPEQSGMPEDIATLYSRAQIQGNRYWDFSASRKEVRGQFRHRAGNTTVEAPPEAPQGMQEATPDSQAAPVLQVPQQDQAPPGNQSMRESTHTLPFQAPPAERPVHTMPARAVETHPDSDAGFIHLGRSPMQAVQPIQPFPLSMPVQPMPVQPMPVQPVPVQTVPVQPAATTGARWYAMQAVFVPEAVVPAPQPPASLLNLELRSPVVAVLSLAGGVGKTCLVATLGRALSSLGERVLLADTAACGLLPFYFGSRAFKPGVVRTFTPPGSGTQGERDAPVHVLNLEAELYPGDGGEQDLLLGHLVRDSHQASRVLIDVATASREVMRRLLRLRPTLLIPILPDMSSVASLGALEAFLGREWEASSVYYVLNQFSAASPFHQDLRRMLQQRLGNRLLPVVLSRSAAVSEALAEGMTVIDYAPGSPAAEDYWHLAGWLRSIAAPAAAGFGGVRWSER